MGKKVKIVEVTTLVPSGTLRLQGTHGSLELMMWKGQPAVLVDGKHIIRHNTLRFALSDAGHLKEAESNGE